MNISNFVNRSIDVITREGKPSIISKLSGGTIEGNGVARKMKAAKRANNFYTTAGVIAMPYGITKCFGGIVGKGIGVTAFMGGVACLCEGATARDAIKALKPEYKEIVARAKKIYA